MGVFDEGYQQSIPPENQSLALFVKNNGGVSIKSGVLRGELKRCLRVAAGVVER